MHDPDDVLREFDATQERFDPSGAHGSIEKLFVTVTVAFLIWRLAPVTQYVCERLRIDQQPAFDVRIRHGHNHHSLVTPHDIGNLLDAIRIAAAIRISSHDKQVWKRDATTL